MAQNFDSATTDILAQALYNKMCCALSSSNEAYNLEEIVIESSSSGCFFKLLKRTCFRFRGIKKKFVEVAPILYGLMESYGVILETCKNGWKRTPRNDFEQWLDSAPLQCFIDIYDKILESNGFDCCSHYMECSNVRHCVHSDIMFAGQCTYRKKLKAGIIFFGENRNVGQQELS